MLSWDILLFGATSLAAVVKCYRLARQFPRALGDQRQALVLALMRSGRGVESQFLQPLVRKILGVVDAERAEAEEPPEEPLPVVLATEAEACPFCFFPLKLQARTAKVTVFGCAGPRAGTLITTEKCARCLTPVKLDGEEAREVVEVVAYPTGIKVGAQKLIVEESDLRKEHFVLNHTAYEARLFDAFLGQIAIAGVTFHGWCKAYNHQHGVLFTDDRKLDPQHFQHAFVLFMFLKTLWANGYTEHCFDIGQMMDPKDEKCRACLAADHERVLREPAARPQKDAGNTCSLLPRSVLSLDRPFLEKMMSPSPTSRRSSRM